MKHRSGFAVGMMVLVLSCGLVSAQIPRHPSELTYKTLTYAPPKPAEYRTVLSNGIVVYIMEEHMLPVVDIQAVIRTGTLYDTRDKVGLAELTGTLLRRGGTEKMSPADLDERLDYLGASMNSYMRADRAGASLSVLTKDTDEGLQLFADMLMHPGFDAEKLRIALDQAVESLKTRNDEPRSVLNREFAKLLYSDHPVTWEETKETLGVLTRDDLKQFHQTYYTPNNVFLAVAGDFDKAAMLAKLEKAFGGWQAKPVRLPKLPTVAARNRPGVFMVQKDISQGYINVGHFGIQDNNPDVHAVRVMNFILGGGSFTSRITMKVRSDEGLAYNTGSTFDIQRLFPGLFYGYVQTKSATVHYAISLIINEFKRIQREMVTDAEMATAKNYYIDSFPDLFTSSLSTMSSFVDLEYNGYPMDYYDTYRTRIEAVTKEDVRRVAKKYIKPEALSIFVVGDVEACKAGYDQHPGTLDQLGPVTVIELK